MKASAQDDRNSHFSFYQVHHTLWKIEAMASTLDSDNSANNCVLKLDDILEAICAEVGTNAGLKENRGIRKEGQTLKVRTYIGAIANMKQIDSKAFYLNKITITRVESDIIGIVFLVFALKTKVPVGGDEQGIFVPSKILVEPIQCEKNNLRFVFTRNFNRPFVDINPDFRTSGAAYSE